MHRTQDTLLSLIRKGALGDVPTSPLGLSTDERKVLYTLSSSQDMAHIVGGFLQKSGDLTDDEPSKQFQKAINVSHFRFVQTENAQSLIATVLEDAEIPFIPLKGAVLRSLYPDPTMRTSCDIDILVREEHLDAAIAALVEKGGYTAEKRSTCHEVSLYSVDRIHIELHYALIEGDGKMADALLDVWQNAYPKEGCRYHHLLTNEMLLLYHTVHMAKHFIYGGCGIRPFLDLHFLQKGLTYDHALFAAHLEQAGLSLFYEQAGLLCGVWFGDAKHTPLTRQMQAYVCSGGVYGTMENHARVAVAKKGRRKHFWGQLFPSARYMKKRYDTLRRWPILLPWFYTWRILCFAVKPYAKDKVKVNVEVAFAGDGEKAKQTADMMTALGMDDTLLL